MKNGKNIMPSNIVIEEFHQYRPQPVRTTNTVQTTRQYMQEKRPLRSRLASSFTNLKSVVFSL